MIFFVFFIFRVEDGRTHKQTAFSILHDPSERPLSEVDLAARQRLSEERFLRARSGSFSSTTSEPSPRHLTLDEVHDTKFGKLPPRYPLTAPSSAAATTSVATRRAHEFSIVKNHKFIQDPTVPSISLVGKARRSYHGSLPTLWKRAGHDTRVMHERRETQRRDSRRNSSISTEPRTRNSMSSERGRGRETSIASTVKSGGSRRTSNPSSTQKGLLRLFSGDREPFPLPSTPVRSKSAIRLQKLTEAQKAAQRRAKSTSPFPKKRVNVEEPDPNRPAPRGRVKGPFEVMESEESDQLLPLTSGTKRVSKPTNLSPIAGTPNRSSEGATSAKSGRFSAGSKLKSSIKTTSATSRLKSAVTTKSGASRSSTAGVATVATKNKLKSTFNKDKTTISGRGKNGPGSAGKSKSKGKSSSSKASSDERKSPGKKGKTSGKSSSDERRSAKSRKSASSSKGMESKTASAKSRTSQGTSRERSQISLQKSISTGTLRSQKSEDARDAELNKSASFRLDRRGLTSATSTASNKSAKSGLFSIGSIGRLKTFASRRNGKNKTIDEGNEPPKTPSSIRKAPVERALEKKASKGELTKKSSKESMISSGSQGTSSRSTSRSKLMGSTTSLARAKVDNEISTTALAAHTSNVTATVTEQLAKDADTESLRSIRSRGGDGGPPVTPNVADNVILEKSKKTLESIQRTVSDAAEEIQKTIEENLTDLKTLENVLKSSSIPPSAKSTRATPGTGSDDGVKTNSSRIVSQKSFDNESNNNVNNSVNLIDVENNNVLPLANSFEKDDDRSMRDGATKSANTETQSGSASTPMMMGKQDSLDKILPADDPNNTPSTSQAGMQR